MSIHSILRICLIAMYIFCEPLYAQEVASLKIIFPVKGTIVKPGEVINVIVEANGFHLRGIEYVSEAGLDGSYVESERKSLKSSNQFQLVVPSDTGDVLSIAAIATSETNQTVKSIPVSLSVPVVINVTQISVVNNNVTFSYPGQQFRLDTRENTDKGWTQLEVEYLTYQSLNSEVASVNTKGEITAQSNGTTQIVVSYGSISTSVPVVVNSFGVPGDLTGNKQVDVNDVNVIYRWRNTSASGPSDARDLNHDGVIDEKDLEIEKTLCTYANCATHQ